jgi:histidinol-phosphate aminotransferase
MSVTRRSFVRALGLGGAGLVSADWVSARGSEAMAVLGPRAMEVAVGSTTSRLIRLSSNENPYGPSPEALQAVRERLSEAGRYPHGVAGDLPQEVADLHGLPADHVLAGCGSGEILRVAVQAFTSPQRALVTPVPSFEAPEMDARRIGTHVEAVPVDARLSLDLDAMLARASGAGLCFVCNPNNPTGTVRSAAAIADFVCRIKHVALEAVVLIDEAYHECVDDPAYGTAIPLAMEEPRVIVSRTLSKIHGMAGLRVGYAIAQPETLAVMRRWLLPNGVNLLGRTAAIVSLRNPAHVKRQQQLNRAAREFTTRAFTDLGYETVPSQTNFIMVDVRRPVREFQSACRARGVLIGRPFPPLQTHARISIGTMDEMREAMAVFRKVLTSKG